MDWIKDHGKPIFGLIAIGIPVVVCYYSPDIRTVVSAIALVGLIVLGCLAIAHWLDDHWQ